MLNLSPSSTGSDGEPATPSEPGKARQSPWGADSARNKARLLALYEKSPAALYTVDTEGILLAVSDGWLRLLGYRRDEVVGHLSYDFLTPSSRDQAYGDTLTRLLRDGRIDQEPLQFVAKSGVIVDVLLSVVLEKAQSPSESPRYLGVIEDVTPHRRAEKVLLEERRRLVSVIAGTQTGTWEWNVQTGEIYLNEQWANILGYTLTELLPLSVRTFTERVHPDDLPDLLRLLRARLAGEAASIEYEARLRHRDGHWVAVLIRGGQAKHIAGKKPEWVYGTLQDHSTLKAQEEALRKSELFRASIEHLAGIGGWELDLDSGAAIWSEELCRIAGVPYGYAPGLEEGIRFTAPEARQQVLDAIERSKRDSGEWDIEVPFYRADGERIWIRNAGKFEYDHGRPVRLIGAVQDTTAQHEAAEAMRHTLALQSAIFDSANLSIISTDPQGVITTFNRAAQHMLGYSETEMVGIATPELIHDRDEMIARAKELSLELGRPVAPGFEVIVAHARTDGAEQREWTYIRRDGTRFPVQLSVTALRDAHGAITGFLGIGADISAHKEAETKLLQLANYDPLTGLANRGSLRQAAERLISAAGRQHKMLATIFLDLDRFKEVNDTMGHQTGDKLLQMVAIRLKSCIRETDVVARLGGDEFVILLPGIGSADEVGVVTEKIQQRFAQPMSLSGHQIFIGASMGVSIYPDDGEDAMHLFRCADSALYQAKAEGRNNVQFYRRELTVRVEEKLHTLSALRQAIDKGEFELHYQPIVSLRDFAPVGAEALLRWRHPTRGLLAPDAFIAIAEESGLIVPIGEWVIAEACRAAAKAWQANNSCFTISINVSARQFKSEKLVPTVREALRDSGLEPRRLCLEITEQLLLNDSERNMDLIRELKSLGVRIAIDDFGTGYSSLSYIKRFSPDILKIDRSFVTDVADNPDDAAIVQAILAMANSMQIKVVAEGVETGAQRNFLQQRRCDMAQGYLYSRPAAYHDWQDWLSTQKH